MNELKEVKFLGRKIKWTISGITYEADPTHVSILAKEWDLCDCKFIGSPGTIDEKKKLDEPEKELLDKENSRIYRRAAARLNYLSLDRPDISYSTKKLRDAWRTRGSGTISP